MILHESVERALTMFMAANNPECWMRACFSDDPGHNGITPYGVVVFLSPTTIPAFEFSWKMPNSYGYMLVLRHDTDGGISYTLTLVGFAVASGKKITDTMFPNARRILDRVRSLAGDHTERKYFTEDNPVLLGPIMATVARSNLKCPS